MTLPDTAVGRQVAWLVSSVGPDGCDEAGVREHFAPSFLDGVGVATVLAVMAGQPWMSDAALEIGASSELAMSVSLSVDGDTWLPIGQSIDPKWG